MYGWSMQYHTHNSQRSDPGWPDEVLCHPGKGRALFVELKTEKGRLTQPQKNWLEHLARCGLETAVWRPSDINHIVQVLGPQQIRLHNFNAV